MRYYLFLLTLLIAQLVFAQKDSRAILEIKGRISEISVSPNENIWLASALGKTYVTANIDSNWHYCQAIFKENGEYSTNGPRLERVSFFNNDTAIMTGYISVDNEEWKKNGFYLTKDGGKKWELLDFGGDSWIYNVSVDKNGNAWMGGSSGSIHYSSDYGQHWKKLNSPYNQFSRMHSIFMLNQKEGISGALNNDTYATKDNWSSHKKIETPFDQKKYPAEEGYSDNRIEKIALWNNYIIVNQQGHIFYTETSEINWKEFPINIIDFEIDKTSNKVIAITSELKVISFVSTPKEFIYLSNKPLSHFPLDIKVVNSSLFAIDHSYEIYKINATEFIQTNLYTADHKIAQPKLVKKGSKLTWGVTGNQIYLSENNGQDWYRENAIAFNISDLGLLNDSTVLLWDGIKSNYSYSLTDRTAKLYSTKNPLAAFIQSPIKYFSINAGSRGCFHHFNNVISYTKVNDTLFVADSISENKGLGDASATSIKSTINAKLLENIFDSINENPSGIPSIKDFNINEEDKKNYLKLVDERIKEKDSQYAIKKSDKDFYYSIPSKVDTLDPSIISSILNKNESGLSTTSNWFTIEFINEKNDTISFSRNFYINALPWHLPWKVEYNGLNFNCYNIEFSRYINNCIPKDFIDKEVFDNKLLIMQIAEYLKTNK